MPDYVDRGVAVNMFLEKVKEGLDGRKVFSRLLLQRLFKAWVYLSGLRVYRKGAVEKIVEQHKGKPILGMFPNPDVPKIVGEVTRYFESGVLTLPLLNLMLALVDDVAVAGEAEFFRMSTPDSLARWVLTGRRR